MPNEQKSADLGDLVGGQRGARHLDHGADDDAEPVAPLLDDHGLGHLPQPSQLLGESHQRVHDLDPGRLVASAARTIARTCIS